jgi:hypothetical protein
VSPSGKYVVQGGAWVANMAGRDASREAVVAPAMRGIKEREREALAENLERIDPRLAGAARVSAKAAAFAGATPLMAAALAPGTAAVMRAPGVLGGAARFAATPAGGALIGGAEGARRGPVEAAQGAAMGAIGGPASSKLIRFLGRFRGGGKAAALAGRLAAQEARAVGRVPAAVSIPSTTGTIPAAVSIPSPSIGRAVATEAAAPAVRQATMPGSTENLLLQLKDMNSTAAGRKQLLEYLKTQPPEVAVQIRALLGPATRHRPFIGGR